MWDSIYEFEEMLRDEECDSVDALKSSGMTVVALYYGYDIIYSGSGIQRGSRRWTSNSVYQW